MRQLVRNTKIVVVHHSEDKKYKSRVKKIKIVGNIIYLFFQKLFFTLNISEEPVFVSSSKPLAPAIIKLFFVPNVFFALAISNAVF